MLESQEILARESERIRWLNEYPLLQSSVSISKAEKRIDKAKRDYTHAEENIHLAYAAVMDTLNEMEALDNGRT